LRNAILPAIRLSLMCPVSSNFKIGVYEKPA
jgi:hypothetical protein